MRLYLCVVVALAGWAGLAGCRVGRGALHPEGPAGIWYVMRADETVEEVAARTGTPPEDVLELNGIEPGETVPAGRLIFMLDGGSTRAAGQAQAPPAALVASSDPRLLWPIEAPTVSSPFGMRGARPHEGIDLAAATGTPVHAAAAGDVIYAGDGIRGYGNLVVLQHPGGLMTVYAHNAELKVRPGDVVAAGQVIALVGQTGRASAPHLHFEVRAGQIPQDPMRYLGAAKDPPP